MQSRLKMLPQRAQLKVSETETVEVERLGKGRYTTAWKNCTNVYLQVSEKDASKEIMCDLDSPYLPNCERLKSLEVDRYSEHNWFKMPLYQPLTAKHKVAWNEFKVLKSLRDDAFRPQWNDKRCSSELNYKFAEMVEDSALSDELKEAIDSLADKAADYGEYMIEITKKNCAVDETGHLILLDPLFDYAEVKAYWDMKRKEARG